MQKSIDSPRAVLCGDRELYLFTVELKDEPGALVQVLSVIASYGLNIVNIYSTQSNYEETRKTIEINFSIDFTGKNVSVEQIAKSINMLNVVVETKVFAKQLPNILVDENHYPLVVLGDRAIIFREPSYTALFQGIRRQLGTAGEALLYHIGFNIGKGSGARLKKILQGRYHLLDSYLKYWMIVHSAARITDVNIDFNTKKAVIRVEDNYECRAGMNYGKPYSHLFRASIAGILNEIVGIETLVETKCIAAGDPYCEFKTPEE